jgi:hypothetical protein
MAISADFEKQKQYFVKKLLLYRNIALSQYCFIAISQLPSKIARLPRALTRYVHC